MTIAQGAYQHLSCLSIHSRARFFVWGVGALGKVPLPRVEDAKSPASEVSNFSLPIGHYRWATASSGQTCGSAAAEVRPLQARAPPGARAQQGAPGAARRLLEEAGRPAARGCAPVCVQSGCAGCAPSRAAKRKQTRGNSSAPSALARHPPPAPLLAPARPPAGPARPSPRPARLAPPPPRPAPAGAGSLTYRPTRALAHAPRAPRRPPGSWPLESKVRAMRGDPAALLPGAARGSF